MMLTRGGGRKTKRSTLTPDIVFEVLYPEWYRQRIMEKIEENLKKYLSMKKDCIDNSDLCTR